MICIYIYICVVLICTVFYIFLIMCRFNHSKRYGPGPCDPDSMEVYIAVQVASGPGARNLSFCLTAKTHGVLGCSILHSLFKAV